MDNEGYNDYAQRFVIDWLRDHGDRFTFSGNDMWAAGLQKKLPHEPHNNGRRLSRVFRELLDDGFITKCLHQVVSVEGHRSMINLYQRSWHMR